MADDRNVKDPVRDPEREAPGPTRGGARAATGRAAGKVARKVAKTTKKKKTTTKKTTAAAGGMTGKAARPEAKTDKSVPAGASASPPKTAARAPAPKTGTARARTATATSGAARGPEAAAASGTAAERAAGTGVAPPHGSGPAIEAPPPPAPMHPGAAMESGQEQAGGLGSLLALWGPLIIVGFLVLVFHGGEERESTAAGGPGAPGRVAMDATPGTSRGAQAAGAMSPATGAPVPARPPGIPGSAPGIAEAFDGGSAMRTSMAAPPVFAGREPGAGIPAGAPGRFYPSPPGPYRDPRYRSLPTGESWSPGGAGEWGWSADGRPGPGRDDGGGAPVQWVRCAPPYYWCPAPGSPAW